MNTTFIYAFILCFIMARVCVSSYKVHTSGLPCLAPELDLKTGHAVFCGRGPNSQQCSPGYSCHIHPADVYAVCCPEPFGLPVSEKPGSCPPLLPGTVGICLELCTGDFSCPGISKCCSNGCGHVCKEPTFPRNIGK